MLLDAALRSPSVAPARLPRWEPGFEPCYLAFLGITLLLTIAVASTDFTADASLFGGLLQMAVMLISAVLLRRFGFSRLGGGIEAAALLTGFSVCAALMSLVLAATALPLADPLLAQADHALFGRKIWVELVVIARAWPTAMAWLSIIYDTLTLQPLLLIAALLAVRARARLSAFLLAWMIALALTLAIAPFAPAVAAYLHFGVGRESISGLRLHVAWDHVETLFAVRSGALRHLGMDSLFGIITFPSFHAAGAVLLGWGFHGVPLLRWPFHALNAALFVSAIFVGGHYIVDLIAGLAIAIVALLLASWIGKRGLKSGRDERTRLIN
jgi:hypothetical protein